MAPMSTPWIVVVCVGVATIAIKAAGPVLLGGRPLPERVTGLIALLAPALLAALVAINTFATGKELVVDARLAGVLVGGVAAWRRAPALLVVILAAAVTAGVRAFG
jgi:branched-subunit amino acid transport protein